MTIFTNNITFTDTSPNKPISTLGKDLISSTTGSAARTAINAQEQFTYGTWVPAYSMSTSGSVTTEASTGEYLLIPPDYVYVIFAISSKALNSPVGSVRITLPFPGITGTPVTFRAQSWGSTVTYLQGTVASNSTIREFISLQKNTPGQAAVNVSSTDLATGTNVNFLQGAVLYRRFFE